MGFFALSHRWSRRPFRAGASIRKSQPTLGWLFSCVMSEVYRMY
jgi:hypothetical protein